MGTVFEGYFGFTQEPFGRDIDTKNLFESQGQQELLHRLRYVTERRQFALITGEVGSGKTTAVRALSATLNPAKYRVLYLSESALTPRNFYWETLRQLDQKPSLSLILMGQPELRRILQVQIYEAVAQRLNLRFHLPGMELAETAGYIVHRLKVAGVTNPLFTEDAVELIHEYSGGVARKVNNVCTACLLNAFAQRKQLVDDRMVRTILDNEFAC